MIFSSGSTGVPKGVMLTHANILANVDSLAQIFPMEPSDCFIGVLPFFHSFGLTGTLWFPLLQGRVRRVSPESDGREDDRRAGRSTPGQDAHQHADVLRLVSATLHERAVRTPQIRDRRRRETARAAGDGIPRTVRRGSARGLRLHGDVAGRRREPAERRGPREKQIGTKPGSVGHPIPGVAARIVDQETGDGPIFDREGLLLVKGPNLMAGYLNQPEKTAEVMRDGWYVTGDIAKIDEDGFIFITDRLSRFSKIGGEMVPHVRIEEAINEALGDSCSAVTAVPDPARGERLVVFHTRADVAPETLWERLSQTELPKLWLPRRENIHYLEAIPTLGTGKVDLRRLRQLAAERTGVSV